MLSPATEALWREYLRAEQDRIRAVMMPALDRFIVSALEEPRHQWESWAKGVAAAISDAGADIPVRLPLFRRVLLPALTRGVLEEEPGCARWLASFPSHLAHLHDPDLPPHLRSRATLLTEAVRIDPSDELARRSLIGIHADRLEYSLHELPHGVLNDHHALADLTECERLSGILAEFKEHVHLTRQADRFADLIQECERHYRLYREYLESDPQSAPQPGGYERFLEDREAG